MSLDPLHQFQIKPYIPIEIAGYDLSFTNSSLFMVLAAAGTIAFMSAGINHRALIPGRLQSAAEMMYEFVANMLKDQTGPKGRQFFPFVFTVFSVVLFGNMLGMVPYSFTYTSHIIVTLTLAMVVFLTVTAVGFLRHGLHFFSLFAPAGAPAWLLPLIVPIEMLSYLSRPVSLSVRLFANMMAGHTMLKVFAGFSVLMGVGLGVAPLVINIALTGFEILVAFLQAYVFAVLTCVYLRDAIELH